MTSPATVILSPSATDAASPLFSTRYSQALANVSYHVACRMQAHGAVLPGHLVEGPGLGQGGQVLLHREGKLHLAAHRPVAQAHFPPGQAAVVRTGCPARRRR